MKKYFEEKFILIIFFLTIVFVTLVLIFGTRVPTPSPVPAPIPQASPMPTQTIISTNIQGQTFRVIEPIVLNFAQPQATPSVAIKIGPADPFVVKQVTPETVSIEPELVWHFNTSYTLTVTVAGKSYDFTFKTEERRGI